MGVDDWVGGGRMAGRNVGGMHWRNVLPGAPGEAKHNAPYSITPIRAWQHGAPSVNSAPRNNRRGIYACSVASGIAYMYADIAPAHGIAYAGVSLLNRRCNRALALSNASSSRWQRGNGALPENEGERKAKNIIWLQAATA